MPYLLSGMFEMPRLPANRAAAAEGGKRVLFYSGDDAAAKGEVSQLIDRFGFFGIDLGPLSVGAKLAQFTGGPLPGQNLVKFSAQSSE